MMNRLFSRSSTPQGHAPRPSNIPPVDVSATRGKHRTANAHTAKRDRRLKSQRPPRNITYTSHAGASNSNTPPPGTSNAVGGTTLVTLQIRSSTGPPAPLVIAHAPHASCFAVLARFFPRL
ncbi:uncharacterized protein EDB93DRAFT_1104930 [Suillus bovinus]|uniref:uncharacterized protein n=1 Tax=Suillus bovinus TaxID=48563 RepID=UPI001B87BCC8|nr:uncharacterized protein EDB93DRAFT_1104930 [Suillus bovinus]KAG2144359.1 hypothetical protein EDB93DRAFT_1104930 [Suillus bovinus]